ncbi:hypothetical protein V9T40_008183 [Parthenolecanium corni]|uniref:CCHC-type domain-containing protein n=1 Tax=Parthenolecanium corni TaxID=536013 RepID=A0AAN9U042_9HEMI
MFSKIKNEAGVELAALPELPQTWAELKKFLESKYEDQQTFEKLFNKLTSTTQKSNESISDYASHLQTLAWRAKSKGLNHPSLSKDVIRAMVNNQSKQRFIDFCQPELSQHLRCVATDLSLQEALARATLEENKLKETKKFRQNKYCSFCKNSTHNTNECRNHNNPSSPGVKFCTYCKIQGHTVDECRKKKSQEANIRQVQAQSADKKFCNYCKRENHVISDCRKLKWKKEQEDKNKSKPASNLSPEFQIKMVQLQEAAVKPNYYVSIHSPKFKRNLIYQVDSGAKISLMKQTSIPDELQINTSEQVSFKGLGNTFNQGSTVGFTYLCTACCKFS